MDFLINIDTDIFLFFNRLHCDMLDPFMKTFSGRFVWIPMYAALLFMVVKMFTARQALAIVFMVAAVIALTDQACATLIRPYFERLRPSNLDNPLSALTHIVGNYRGGSYGFPSCHAANSFALATFMALLFRSARFRTAIFIWATFNSYSRIYLGVHYPGDLLVGALIGSLIAVGCHIALRHIAFSGHAPRYCRSEERSVIYAVPSGAFGQILSLKVINFRYTDLFGFMLAATTLCIAAASWL